jgi:hypothetical protein
MEDFDSHCASLARLNIFDPSAFRGDEDVPQHVCSLILALALVWNDCKDICYARSLLQDSKPDEPARNNKAWGEFGGVDVHLFRLEVALMHELFGLICRSEVAVRSDSLADLLAKLPAYVRDTWASLVQVALGATPTDPFGRCLLMIRNKISSHYDPKVIFRGFHSHFLGEDPTDEWAYVSRGANMATSRFYFADAAALGYLSDIPGGEDWESLRKDVRSTLDTLNFALMGLVEGFVQRRAGAYREIPEEVA